MSVKIDLDVLGRLMRTKRHEACGDGERRPWAGRGRVAWIESLPSAFMERMGLISPSTGCRVGRDRRTGWATRWSWALNAVADVVVGARSWH